MLQRVVRVRLLSSLAASELTLLHASALNIHIFSILFVFFLFHLVVGTGL
jgi:hypothetical protein